MTWTVESEGRCVLLVHGDESPTADEYERFMSTVERVGKETGAGRLVVYAAGNGAPTASQRRDVSRINRQDVRGAVLSDSRIIRGVVTAISWVLGDRIRAFAPSDRAGVAAYLELDADEVAYYRSRLRALSTELKVTAPW